MTIINKAGPVDRGNEGEPYEKVIAFISRFMGINEASILPDTGLQKLGLDGDDATNFMETFADEFSVDLKDFEIRRYFGSEGSWLPNFWKKQQTITVRDLADAAKNGTWQRK